MKTIHEGIRQRLLRLRERSTICYLKQKKGMDIQMAKVLDCHHDKVDCVPPKSVDHQPALHKRQSSVAVFDKQASRWLEHLNVRCMLELAHHIATHFYLFSEIVFYHCVQRMDRVAFVYDC